ncbi:M16 family metallopeptidase [Fimbriimonas ginsengisoli]|uniref:Zinc protease n=1 Tax=Fimbriimonas ginsengisoli Gsoil 348 TaxID=661478 RepID=A0A068NKZ0_FIMGI|nr:pitrilysin family protein [Fimbriimonas ginsengisoli]AIE84141.1 Zinc protease [Fimbriimonas ginsengisoli Gsoil 348]
MPKKFLIASFAVLAAAASAQDVKVEKYRLPNGMTVILHPDHTLPVVTINTWYHVGSKDEPPHRSGFAHLFEHLMFMGTRRVPNGQFDKIMEASGGNNNASTAEDRTNYYSNGPSNLLPTLLWLDADRLEDLGNSMTKAKVDLQRDVVKNERRQNTENTPYGSAYEAINGLMFPPTHPYGHSVIGSMDDLDRASVKDVQNFFATYYVPNNASLVVAGDFDPKTVKPMIARLFGTIPRKKDPVHRTAPNPTLPSVKRVKMTDKVQFPKTIMVWHSPAAYTPGDAEMRLAGAALSDGLTSRLYQRLVVKDKLATDVSAFQESRKLGSLFYVDSTAAQGVSLDKLEKAIDQTLAEFTKKGPKADELQRTVAKIQFGTVSSLQSIQAVADKLNEYEFYLGEPNSFRRVLETYRNATPASVQKAARRTLDLNHRLILRVYPRPETTSGSAPERFQNPRDQRPKIGPEKPFAPAPPKIFTLSNGVKVEYWNRPQLPLMAVNMMLWGGAALDPQAKLGRAELTASMLDEGAGKRSASAFQNALDQLGATFSAGSDQLSTAASMSVLSSNWDKALGLYADAILRPRFDPTEFARVLRVTAAGLEQEVDDADTVARKVSLREYFGETNPFGRPVSGTPATVRALKVADLKAAHAEVFCPQNATLFVAGSLPQAKVKASLERAFSGWKRSGVRIGLPNATAPTQETLRVVVVDKPAAPQTVIRFMFPAPTYSSPNREALTSLGTILGGSFTSRLNQNLREAKGYAYGAGSRFVFGPTIGYLTASSDVRTDVTGPSITEFLSEFKKIRNGDVTAEEAGKAASTRRAELVTELGTLPGLLGAAQGYELNGLPFTQIGKDIKTLSAVGAAKLNALATEAIPMDRGVLVLVGDKTQILKQLAGLGLPEPKVVKP